MSWCDKMASTPAVGLRFANFFATQQQILSALAPILEENASETKVDFSLNDAGPFAITINTKEGYQYTIDHQKIAVTFTHRVHFRPVSGGPPVMEMLSKPRPYTTLLIDCAERLVRAAMLMRSIRQKNFSRVGIVSTTLAEIEELPPGFEKLLSHIASPWDNSVSECELRIIAKLTETDKHSDRCLHQMIVREDKSELPTVVLDWQRNFLRQQTADERTIRKAIDEASEAALGYFEDVAEGARFDV